MTPPISGLRQAVWERHRRNWILLVRFGVVGVSGVVVNMIALIVANKLGPAHEQALFGLPFGDFNVRWYHVFSTIAFVVANVWNFQLNRSWAFQSSAHAGWWKEYGPFLAVGALGQAVGLLLLTMLMHQGSPLALSTSVFDDSSGFRTRLYWAQLIVIGLITPVSFVLNKVWTFNAVRELHRQEREERARQMERPQSEPARAGTRREG